MKKISKNIVYLGIAYGCAMQNYKEVLKTGLPIKKLKEALPFARGELQIYSAMLPEYAGSTFFRHKNKCWKPEQAIQILEETDRRFRERLAYREIVLEEALQRDILHTAKEVVRRDVPIELLATRLYASKPFEKVCVSLPTEGGDYQLEQAIYLLEPYLAGLQQVAFIGTNERLARHMEEYLYEEYGMLMTRERRPTSKSLWLDLREEEAYGNNVSSGRTGIKYINWSETLKFLDTTVKNGYNTKVN